MISSDVKNLLPNIPEYSLGKSCLVTGATGIIGTYLVETLKQLSYSGSDIKEIHAVSLSGNVPSWTTKDKIVKRHFGDISNPNFCSSLPKVDFIIHAAGYGQPGKFTQDPIKTYLINTSATINLFKCLDRNGSFLFISSSELYSGIVGHECTESEIGSTFPDHPRASYIEGKRGGEFITDFISRELEVMGYSARVALGYGPGTQIGDKRVINEMIWKGINNQTINLLDSGQASRTYCYITDIVYQLLLIASSKKPGVYNVGGISETTIEKLARKIGNICKVEVTVPKDSGGITNQAPKEVKLSLDKTFSLGPEPQWTYLNEGLYKTIDWQRENLLGVKQ